MGSSNVVEVREEQSLPRNPLTSTKVPEFQKGMCLGGRSTTAETDTCFRLVSKRKDSL